MKATDTSGQVFACQQFTWLFSNAFLRNNEAVQQTISLLTSNPNSIGPEAYNRQAQAYLRYDALDRLVSCLGEAGAPVGQRTLAMIDTLADALGSTESIAGGRARLAG